MPSYIVPNPALSHPSDAEISLAGQPTNRSAFGYLQAFAADRSMAARSNEAYTQQVNLMNQQQAQRDFALKGAGVAIDAIKGAGVAGASDAIQKNAYLREFLRGSNLAPLGEFSGRTAESKILHETVSGLAAGAKAGIYPQSSYVTEVTGMPYLTGLPVGGAPVEKSEVTLQVLGSEVGAGPGAMATVKVPRNETPAQTLARVSGGAVKDPLAPTTVGAHDNTVRAYSAYNKLSSAAQADVGALMASQKSTRLPLRNDGGKLVLVGMTGTYEVK